MALRLLGGPYPRVPAGCAQSPRPLHGFASLGHQSSFLVSGLAPKPENCNSRCKAHSPTPAVGWVRRLCLKVRPLDSQSPSQLLTPPVTPSSSSVSKLTDNITHRALAPAVH